MRAVLAALALVSSAAFASSDAVEVKFAVCSSYNVCDFIAGDLDTRLPNDTALLQKISLRYYNELGYRIDENKWSASLRMCSVYPQVTTRCLIRAVQLSKVANPR